MHCGSLIARTIKRVLMEDVPNRLKKKEGISLGAWQSGLFMGDRERSEVSFRSRQMF